MSVPSYQDIINKYLNMRPGGYLSPEDMIASERTRSRLRSGVQTAAKGRRIGMSRSLVARGLNASPAASAAELGISQDEALGLQQADEAAAGQEYNSYSTNRGYMQNLVAQAMGGELAGAEAQRNRDALRNSTFWNSILETAPTLLSFFGGGAARAMVPSYATGPRATGGGGGATYDPRVRNPLAPGPMP